MRNTSWASRVEQADQPRRPTSFLIRAWRCLRLLAHLLWGVLTVACVFPSAREGQRLRLKQKWSRQLLELLNIRIDANLSGAIPGSLFVANHVSWLDIYAINATRPVAFVAKSEIRQWPLIGWLAARTDTVFLRRGSGRHASVVNGSVAGLLAAEKDVAIFPEGTTTDGTHLLGFHAALFQAAVDAGRPVQPVALSYFDASGYPSLAPVYAGETSFGQSLRSILACRSLTVRLRATPPLDGSEGVRRNLACRARGAIAFNLGLAPAGGLPGVIPASAR